MIQLIYGTDAHGLRLLYKSPEALNEQEIITPVKGKFNTLSPTPGDKLLLYFTFSGASTHKKYAVTSRKGHDIAHGNSYYIAISAQELPSDNTYENDLFYSLFGSSLPGDEAYAKAVASGDADFAAITPFPDNNSDAAVPMSFILLVMSKIYRGESVAVCLPEEYSADDDTFFDAAQTTIMKLLKYCCGKIKNTFLIAASTRAVTDPENYDILIYPFGTKINGAVTFSTSGFSEPSDPPIKYNYRQLVELLYSLSPESRSAFFSFLYTFFEQYAQQEESFRTNLCFEAAATAAGKLDGIPSDIMSDKQAAECYKKTAERLVKKGIVETLCFYRAKTPGGTPYARGNSELTLALYNAIAAKKSYQKTFAEFFETAVKSGIKNVDPSHPCFGLYRLLIDTSSIAKKPVSELLPDGAEAAASTAFSKKFNALPSASAASASDEPRTLSAALNEGIKFCKIEAEYCNNYIQTVEKHTSVKALYTIYAAECAKREKKLAKQLKAYETLSAAYSAVRAFENAAPPERCTIAAGRLTQTVSAIDAQNRAALCDRLYNTLSKELDAIQDKSKAAALRDGYIRSFGPEDGVFAPLIKRLSEDRSALQPDISALDDDALPLTVSQAKRYTEGKSGESKKPSSSLFLKVLVFLEAAIIIALVVVIILLSSGKARSPAAEDSTSAVSTVFETEVPET